MNTQSRQEDGREWSMAALVAGGAATLLASACCIGPLVLVLVGVSGAWIGNLAGLEPFQPYFAIAACVALVLAGRQIWRTPACIEGQSCAMPANRRGRKLIFIAVAVLLLASVCFPLVAHYFY